MELTSGHLENHETLGIIKTTSGPKFKNVISKLFPGTRHRGEETVDYLLNNEQIVLRPGETVSIPKCTELQKAANKKKPKDTIREWLLKQYVYTLHKLVRKHFPRNPYTVNNITDVWELDLMDLTPLKKYDNYKYLLQVIDVVSKYLHSVPLRSKAGKAVASAFESILQDQKYSKPTCRRPIWLHTDKGK